VYETTFICDTCQPPYRFTKLTEDDPRKVKLKTPACPQCRQRRAQAKMQTKIRGAVITNDAERDAMYAARTKDMDANPGCAPSIRTSSNHTKAIDQTAEIVMQDYQMTDIKMDTSLRAGDNCVPKLSPELERKVDSVFDSKAKNNVMGMAGDNLTKGLLKQIDAGMFKSYGDPVARQQADPTLRPKYNIMDSYDNRKPN
jgi:hypothetical protein